MKGIGTADRGNSIIIFGDILVISKVETAGLDDLAAGHDVLVYEHIANVVGGTAVTAAIAFKSYFRRVVVVGTVGNDAAGKEALEYLAVHACEGRIEQRRGMTTGRGIVIRSRAGSGGARLVVVSRPNANQYLEEGLLRSLGRPAADDVVVMDGYALLEEPRAGVLRRMIVDGYFSDCTLVFDVVPHDASKYWTLSDLAPVLEHVDVVVAEVGTLSALLDLSIACSPPGSDDAHRTADAMRIAFPRPTLLLRFGPGNCDGSLVDVAAAGRFVRATGYSSAEDLTGFGDRVTAFEVAEYVVGDPAR
jgi:sugar/nucleoside kinase (ribokinase family)